MKPKLLLSAPYMLLDRERFVPILESLGFDVIVPQVSERLSEKDLITYAGKIDVTICGDDKYTRDVLDKHAGSLQVISKWGTGIDSIDSAYAEELGIKVCRTENAFTLPVADTVIGFILSFARNIPWSDRAIKSGEWVKLPGHALHERTLGVIGVGNVGKAVIRRARVFGMNCVGNDVRQIETDFLYETKTQMMQRSRLLQIADYVSVNCTLNETSRHLVDQDAIELCKSNCVIINTARGPIVSENALTDALERGAIRGAALDVFEEEPLPDESPLKTMENVLLSAHNSNSSPVAWEYVHYNTVKNLLDELGLVQRLMSFEEFNSQDKKGAAGQ